MMRGYGYAMGPWMWLGMLLVWSLAIGGIALLVVALLRGVMPATSPAGPSRPLEILQERYTRGELTHEQYEQMRQDLGISAIAGDGLRAPPADGRDASSVPGSHQAR